MENSSTIINQNHMEDLKHAGILIRVLAFFIDIAALMICISMALYVVRLFLVIGADSAKALQNIVIFIYTAYLTSAEAGQHQATIGKRICKLYVIEKSGKRISTMRAIARYFISQIFYFGFLSIAFTKDKLALHDWITSSRVIHGKPK